MRKDLIEETSIRYKLSIYHYYYYSCIFLKKKVFISCLLSFNFLYSLNKLNLKIQNSL